MDETKIFEILRNHFETNGFVSHQIGSFNNFVSHDIPKIIRELDINFTISQTKGDDIKYKISFENTVIPKPTIIEENRELRSIHPAEARNRDLTYDSPIYVDIIENITQDGVSEIKTYKRVVIGRIPIMLHSEKCYLSEINRSEFPKYGECTKDVGGYFIIKGKERVLVSQIRGIYNKCLVLEPKPSEKFDYVAEMRSMSDETGHSVLVQIKIINNILTATLPYIKEEVPVGIVFKALGLTDREIIDILNNDYEEVTKYTKIIINGCEPIKEETHEETVQSALRYIGSLSTTPIKVEERVEYGKQIITSEMFPHLGITSTLTNKAITFAYMVSKLLNTVVGMRKPDDRDNYINKRVESPGILCYELFRQLFKKYINTVVSQIDKKKQLPDIMSIVSKLTDITKGFNHCFGTGNWGVPKNNYVRPGVAQLLSRLSYGATISTIRRIAIPIGKESKNSAIRQINPSQIMFLCPVETPEGAPVGIVLNLSLLTRISERNSSILVKQVIEMCDNITFFDEYIQNTLIFNTKVFINGVIIGNTDEPYELLEELKELRKVEMIHKDTSISYDEDDEELHIYTDEGRLLRPIFTLNNDGNLNISPECGIDWNELVENDYIRYIDNMEADKAVIAFNQKDLTKYHNDYCEISPTMMFGVMASIIPFPDHSQSPRNTYQAAMGKQAMSMYALSYKTRTDTVVHVLESGQKPIVNTKCAEFLGFNEMASGTNAIVAIACYTGFNQEDSIIINYSAVQRGLFWATTYRTHSEEERKESLIHEKICLPPVEKRQNNCNYSYLDENGIIKLNNKVNQDKDGNFSGGGSTYVKKGDVIIGKVAIQQSKDGDEIEDCSLVIKKGEEGYIDRIYTSTTPNGYKLVKVVIRKLRIPEIGDKFASRAAQKGTCGMIYSQEDMPYNDEGISPDIIINAHCIPSRMTINQLMESVLGKSCVIEGTYGDSTPFTSASVTNTKTGKTVAEEICERLEMNGYQGSGNEILYNGMTGEMMGEYFMGPVYYQRLKHLVSDKIHARETGPVTTLTRQPLEGRSRDGGLRFGEMERDCFTGDTVITLANGLNIKIKDMSDSDHDVLGYDHNTNGMVSSKQLAFMCKGEKECIEITFNDGRTQICTPTHKLLSSNGEWIMAQDSLHKTLKTSIIGVNTDPIKEIDPDTNWSFSSGEYSFNIVNKDNYMKTMSFARILGYVITDGHIPTNTNCNAVLYLGHQLDADQVINDIKIITGVTVTPINIRNVISINIPSSLTKALHIQGIATGKKVYQKNTLPDFILHPDCPKAVVREFLGGMFGGDGSTCALSMHRGSRDLLASVGFSQSKSEKYIDDLYQTFTNIKNLLSTLGINNVSIRKPKQTTHSKNANPEKEKVYELELHIHIVDLELFAKNIGFRYCCHKTQRLEAGISFRSAKKFNTNCPIAEDYMNNINAIQFYDDYGMTRDMNSIPTMHHTVVDIKPAGLHTVYDIEVRNTHSFLANGVVAHNCMIGHGNSKFLQERLFEKSDKYFTDICNDCGNFATSKNMCKKCNSDNIVNIKLPYVGKLVMQELHALLIKTQIKV